MSAAVFIGLLVLTGAGLSVTLALAWCKRRFLARAVTTSGRITRVTMELCEWAGYGSEHPAQTTRHYTPHVEFALEDGSRVEFRSRIAHPGAPVYREGQVVTVVYDRADPSTTAEIRDLGVWRHAVYAGLATLALLLATVFGKACG